MSNTVEQRAAYTKYDTELEVLLSALTPKQEAFCREYFVSMNATESASRAGYKGNRVTLSAVGYENLGKPQIIAVVDAFMGRKASNTEITAALIEREYWKLYNVALNEKQYPVARACLKDLGEHHAMFVKVVATAEASELALRLAKGRDRMNARQLRETGAAPSPQPVPDTVPASVAGPNEAIK